MSAVSIRAFRCFGVLRNGADATGTLGGEPTDVVSFGLVSPFGLEGFVAFSGAALAGSTL